MKSSAIKSTLKCHDADSEKGDFRIDNLSPKIGFEDTLVLWSGEFGRTLWSQDLSDKSLIDKHGREHQLESFCAWMAGGAVKPGAWRSREGNSRLIT